MGELRRELEDEVRSLIERGDRDGAATAALRGYGPDIFGLLAALHRSEEDAAEVFSVFSESLWKGLPAFGWACSLRTWSYVIARNASVRFRKRARAARGHIPLSQSPSVERLAQEIRTQTQSFLRTERKEQLSMLRDALAPDDKLLLVLRVDRGLRWEELARVTMGNEDECAIDEQALAKESARLRKRFQLVKERLISAGRKKGLVR